MKYKTTKRIKLYALNPKYKLKHFPFGFCFSTIQKKEFENFEMSFKNEAYGIIHFYYCLN